MPFIKFKLPYCFLACDVVFHSILKELNIDSQIINRYATTVVSHKFENINSQPQETVVSVILPEDAYITEFVMIINDKSYKSYVKEKSEAKEIYNQVSQLRSLVYAIF